MPASKIANLSYVIPAFNEERVIGSVVAQLHLHGAPGRIIVVDDASRDATAQVARAAGAIVITHLINRGQGAALQTGFDAALKLGSDVVITFDADGQHDPADTHRIFQALLDNNADVVIASRFLGPESEMPRGRKLLLKAGLFFTRVVSRVKVTDTHNGLRAFSASALRKIRITEDRMAHASELIDLIGQARLRYVEVPCRIRYTEYSMAKGQRWHGAFNIVFDFLLGKMLSGK